MASGTTGVVATNSIDDILALGADCVLYMQQGCDFDDVCRILESGANIVTTRGEFHRPASMDPAVRQRVEDACAKGGTSIHSTGSSPGFISEALPLVLLSMERSLDLLQIDEFADMSSRNSPEMLFQLMGFGSDPAKFDPRRFDHIAAARSARRCRRSPTPSVCRSTPSNPAARSPSPRTTSRSPPARSRPGPSPPSARSPPSPERQAAAALPCELVRHHRPRAGRGTSGRPAGGCRSTATRRSTSRSGSRWSRSATRRCRPASPRIPRSTPFAAVCDATPGIRTTFDLPKVIPTLVDAR